jgi:hypothetical protein
MKWIQGILPHAVEQPGHELDQLLPSSVEISNILPAIFHSFINGSTALGWALAACQIS